MLKIAILTPKNSYSKIKEALKNISEQIDYIFYEDLYKLGEIYLNIAHKYHGIITSGPIGYEVIKKTAKITTPLYFLEISRSDLFKYLFDILRKNPNINFSRIFIDFISEEDRNYWLQNIFSKKECPIFLPLDYSETSLYENFKTKYLTLKENNEIDLALTRISNILPFLEENHIPFKFLFPSSETIREIVLNSINDIKAKKFEEKQIIFGKITCNLNEESFKSLISPICKNCIVQQNKKNIEILIIKEDFFSSNLHNFLKEKLNSSFYIGWGLGNTIGEARYYSEDSYKKNKVSLGKDFFLISSKELIFLSSENSNRKNDLNIIEKFYSLNIVGEKANILIECLKKTEGITADKLASYLNVSERTANRILEKLYKNNIITFFIKKIKRGRPKKFYILK